MPMFKSLLTMPVPSDSMKDLVTADFIITGTASSQSLDLGSNRRLTQISGWVKGPKGLKGPNAAAARGEGEMLRIPEAYLR